MGVRRDKTLKDVAIAAGVSFSTASRVISNHPGISSETTSRVREAVSSVGYEIRRPSLREGHRPRPRRPSSYRKRQIALITQVKPMLLETPVYSKVLRGIGNELDKISYNFILRNLPEDNPEEKIPQKIDGAIIFHVSAMHSNKKLLKALREMCCVRIMGEGTDSEFFDYVSYNNRSVGRLAAEFLLSKGHKRLMYMGLKNDDGTYFHNRRDSFLSTVREAGAEASEIVSDDFIDESGKTQMPNVRSIAMEIEKMKRPPEFPTAIFATADIFAIGLHHTLKCHDIIPGKDVEIVGVNNDSILLNHLSPRPASVDIHPEKIGRRAVARLLWRIDNPKEPLEKIELEPEIAFS